MTRIEAVRDWLGVTQMQARVLLALYDCERGMDRREIAAEIGATPGSVAVALVSIREALNPKAVDRDGLNLSLTATGRAEVAAILLPVGEEG